MNMMHFRDAVIDGMIEQNEQNDGEVLPAERRMSMHRHHLGKDERPARNNRKKCRSCYENIQKEEGSVIARKSQSESQHIVKTVKENQAMCIECFNKKAFRNTFATN